MTIAKEAVEQLWKEGFFRPPNNRSAKDVEKEASEKYGCTYANWSTLLSRTTFLRKAKNGWVQKKPYASEEVEGQTNDDDLKAFLNNPELWRACTSSFKNGEYWDASLHALRHLETKTREKCGLSANDYGIDLVNDAFNPDKGILKIPSCATRAEEEGFLAINRGFFLFHRNPKGHREGSLKRNDAIKIIGYVDYLLDVLKTAKKR